MSDDFILDITWAEGDGPRLVGPFATREAADRWVSQNIANGSYEICPLAYPFMRSQRRA